MKKFGIRAFEPCCSKTGLNSLPTGEIFDMTKLKAFANHKINVARMMIAVLDRVDNIVGKGENAGYQHFLLFPQCLQNFLSWGR